jgi:hypothetical protein
MNNTNPVISRNRSRLTYGLANDNGRLVASFNREAYVDSRRDTGETVTTKTGKVLPVVERSSELVGVEGAAVIVAEGQTLTSVQSGSAFDVARSLVNGARVGNALTKGLSRIEASQNRLKSLGIDAPELNAAQATVLALAQHSAYRVAEIG